MRGRLALWLCLNAAACAAAGGGVRPALPPTAAGASDPELLAANELAPDYVARMREAEAAVRSERSTEGKLEAERRVQLLGDAARAEAARIALLRQADVYEQRIAKAVDQRAQLERQRQALERTRELERAATAERAEAQWVFASLLHGAAPNAHDRDRIWELCVRRAQGLLAAASALGATGEPVTEAELQLTAARTAKLPERVKKGLSALQSAYVALGVARAEHDAPSAAEQGDLQTRLAELGLTAHVDANGLAVDLPGIGSSPEPAVRLALLGGLLSAFPHGPVIAACRGGGCERGLGPLRDRLGARVRVETGTVGVVRVMLPAYAEASQH